MSIKFTINIPNNTQLAILFAGSLNGRACRYDYVTFNFETSLEELIELLKASSEEYWCGYFLEVLDIHNNGNSSASYKNVLEAYGGMCSFNDLTLNFISDSEVAKVEKIRRDLYHFCKSKKRGPFGAFGFKE